MQKSRFEDQRCDFKSTTSNESTNHPNTLRGHRMYSFYCLIGKIKKGKRKSLSEYSFYYRKYLI